MKIVHSLDELPGVASNGCMAIGVFDGVHVGHQRVINTACDDARRLGGTSVALTFDPHPVRVLQPDKAPPLLTSTAHKLQLMAGLGVEACLVLKFDEALASMPPETFVETIARGASPLRVICVGRRFRFGHQRTGDVQLIRDLASRYGYVTREIEPVSVGGQMVSSTAIRQCVLAGDLNRAAMMLGRPVAILGTVERGDGVGRSLGYPTANINPHHEAIPPHGVYVARARLGDETHPGLVNIGVRPTFEGRSRHRTIEIHLLDFDRDIYGRDLLIEFVCRLRDEVRFKSVNELKAQLARDEASARDKVKQTG